MSVRKLGNKGTHVPYRRLQMKNGQIRKRPFNKSQQKAYNAAQPMYPKKPKTPQIPDNPNIINTELKQAERQFVQLENELRPAPKQPIAPAKTPFFKTKAGKATAIIGGLLALGAAFGLIKSCNKSNAVASGNDSIPTNSVSQPVPKPENQQDKVRFDTIYAKKGDCYWDYAKEQLKKDGNKSVADTDSRTRTIMADNGAKLASDSIHSDPMLKVGDPVLIRKSYN